MTKKLSKTRKRRHHHRRRRRRRTRRVGRRRRTRRVGRRRRTRRRRRRRQRGGGCLKNEYIATDPTPAGVAYEPGKNNGLGGGYYYKLNRNLSLLGYPASTVGKKSYKGGHRRGRRTRGRHRHSKKCKCFRRNQRGGHDVNYSRGNSPSPLKTLSSLIPQDAVDAGRSIQTNLSNLGNQLLGEPAQVGGDPMQQPDLPIINYQKHQI